MPLAIEIKNKREVVYPATKTSNGNVLAKLLEDSLNEQRLPVLVASSISSEFRLVADKIGIVVVELGRRIFPKTLPDYGRVSSRLAEFKNVTGPIQFECVGRSSRGTAGARNDREAFETADYDSKWTVWHEQRDRSRHYVDRVRRGERVSDALRTLTSFIPP